MIAPIIWACHKKTNPYGKTSSTLLLILWAISAIIVKSLSFILAVPAIIYYCLFRIDKNNLVKKIIVLMPFAFITAATIYFSVYERIGETVTGNDGSSEERLKGLFEALDVFYNSPFFGSGYAAIRGLDAFSFLLASFGFIGFILILLIILRIYFDFIRSNAYEYSAAMVCLIFSCILSNNVFDHIFIWLFLIVMSARPAKKSYPSLGDRKIRSWPAAVSG